MAIAKSRSGSSAFDGILSIDKTLCERVFAELQIKDGLGVSQSLGAVDVLPVRVAYIKGPQFLLSRQLTHSVRQGTVSVFLRCFEFVKEQWAAQKHSCVEGVIAVKVFANINNMIRFAFDLRGIVQVKDIMHIVIDCQNDLVLCEWLLG